MIAIACVVCLIVGAIFGYLIANKASQHTVYTAYAKGLVDRNDGLSDYYSTLQEHERLRLELQRLRLRNRQLEAKEQVIRKEST